MPGLGWLDSPEASREMEFVYRWLQRARLWTIVTGGAFAVVVIALYGPYGQPSGVPVWIGVLVTSLVGLPCLSMLVVACVHWVRAARARRRDIKAGFVVYTNRFSAWVDYHGIGVGLALVAILLAVGVWLLSYLAGHGVKLGRGY
jgi:hypothetical protein